MAQGNADSGGVTMDTARMQRPDQRCAFRSTRVVTPDGVRAATLLVSGGKIVSVNEWSDLPQSTELRDFADLVLLPGLVDSHVHINEADEGDSDVSRKDWEGFATATRAAASGGVTTLVDMPLNCIPETISVAALEAKRAAAVGRNRPTASRSASRPEQLDSGSQTSVDWMAWGGVVGNGGLGGNEAEIPGLIEAGVPGFKCFLVNSGIETFAWTDEAQLQKTMAVLRSSEYLQLNLPLLAHAEMEEPVLQATQSLNALQASWQSYATYLASRPDLAEIEAIKLLVQLAKQFDMRIHIVHLSTALALPVLRKARAAGLKITVETCPHYLWFAAEEIPNGATEYKCAPPVRSAGNRELLWQALLDGDIDMIATDHSPCPPILKGKDVGRFDQAWGGIASLGLQLPVIWTGLCHRSATLQKEGSKENHLLLVSKWLATEPARLAGLTGRKGALSAGSDADIVVFDPDVEWTVAESDLHFRHKMSPYLGEKLRGRVTRTFLRGKPIFSDSDGPTWPAIASGLELRRPKQDCP